jgi:CRP-like cAMP-binding protein
MIGEMAGELRGLRGGDRSRLRTDPSELLRKVPFFQAIPREEFDRLTGKMIPHTVPDGEVIIREGHAGDSLFLISRGVIRVSRAVEGKEQDIGTMMPGDFFGEMALLHHQPRSATCRAVTPAALYELRRADFEEASASCPSIYAALQEADRKRSGENTRRAQGE